MNRRRLLRRFVAVAFVGAVMGLGVSGTAYAGPPGDNGDVKIHNSGTATDDVRDEPHVCAFYLDAFNFDGVQQVSWWIDEHPPTGTDKVLDGTITLDGNGHGYTSDLSLPDGHYKLYWTFDGENGDAKHKVFWVDCAESSPSPGTSTSASPDPSGSVSASPSATAVGGVGTTPSMSTSPVSDGGSLPVTGAPLGAIAAVAALAIAAGVFLRLRWRRG